MVVPCPVRYRSAKSSRGSVRPIHRLLHILVYGRKLPGEVPPPVEAVFRALIPCMSSSLNIIYVQCELNIIYVPLNIIYVLNLCVEHYLCSFFVERYLCSSLNIIYVHCPLSITCVHTIDRAAVLKRSLVEMIIVRIVFTAVDCDSSLDMFACRGTSTSAHRLCRCTLRC